VNHTDGVVDRLVRHPGERHLTVTDRGQVEAHQPGDRRGGSRPSAHRWRNLRPDSVAPMAAIDAGSCQLTVFCRTSAGTARSLAGSLTTCGLTGRRRTQTAGLAPTPGALMPGLLGAPGIWLARPPAEPHAVRVATWLRAMAYQALVSAETGRGLAGCQSLEEDVNETRSVGEEIFCVSVPCWMSVEWLRLERLTRWVDSDLRHVGRYGVRINQRSLGCSVYPSQQ